MKKVFGVIGWISASLLTLAAALGGGCVSDNLTYAERDMAGVWRAGFVEKDALIDGNVLHYVEGPDNGPALLLIHGQGMDWENYARVLTALSRRFHIYAVDCYGHGASARVPAKYTANGLGADLKLFLSDVVKEPAVVSGHSSGGLLAAWLAANAPEWVMGVILEDPPFFTTTMPRAMKTWNWVDLASTTHDFLESGQTDFVAYNAEHSRLFTLFGGLQPGLVADILAARTRHPDEPVKIWYMPPVMNEMFRGMNHYDPRFGDAFYTGSWDDGFDVADTLARITEPAVLIHTNWSYTDDGILMAAMDADDAERARSLVAGVEFFQVDSGHGFHFEKPAQFIQIVLDLGERLAR